ncbi:MAG TPA: DUF333 domain-containing protein [Gammaproteobacteria bacterium]|nr:DUF333 domain-containing protein [Gammaproteobacteria bacterium]
MKLLRASAPLVALAAILLDACGETAPPTSGSAGADQPREPALAATRAERPNPASQGCIDAGGALQIEKRPGGGEYGVCTFADNRQCEEWALLRGECARGGVKVTGYVTAAARYCAIAGGAYAVLAKSGSVDERGSCTLFAGTVCDADEYFAGACPR